MRRPLHLRVLQTKDHVARCAIFEEYAVLDFPELTDDLLRHLRRVAREAVADHVRVPYSVHVWQEKPTGAIKTWLSDPAAWSPFVDEVAVRRAVAFDWDAIENLSRLEVTEFITRLAGMDDPFELDDLGFTGVRPDGTEDDNFPKSNRRIAWESGSREARQEVLDAVSTRRETLRRRHE